MGDAQKDGRFDLRFIIQTQDIITIDLTNYISYNYLQYTCDIGQFDFVQSTLYNGASAARIKFKQYLFSLINFPSKYL